MSARPARSKLFIPRQWTARIQSALVHTMSLAHYALAYTRSSNDRVRLTAKADDLEQEVALDREEIRLKDARMDRIPPAQRPHYLPTERLAILELRAARGWSL